MTDARSAAYGIFYDKTLAQRSVDRLVAAGIPHADVSLLDPNELGTKDLAHDRDAIAGNSTSVVVSSVAIGGTLGLVAGLGAMAVPVIGPLLVAGPIVGSLIGMGAGGAVGGAIDAADAAHLFEPGAKRYEGHIKEGGILVSVRCHSDAEVSIAMDLLRQSSAQAISQSGEPSKPASIPENPAL